MGDIFQSDYPALETIAQNFKKQAEEIAQMTGNIRTNADQLIDGDWRGEGSQAFSSTVRGQLMPALQRLEQALEAGSTLSSELSKLIRNAEEEAAKVFNGSFEGLPGGSGTGGMGNGTAGTGGGSGNGNGTTGGNGIITKDKSFTSVLIGGLLKGGWQLFKDRNLWRGFLGGVRFVKGADGLWKVFGPRAARTAMGLNPFVNQFGRNFIQSQLDNTSVWNGVKALFKPGQFGTAARNLFTNLTTTPAIRPVTSFMDNFKGGAVLSGLITTGMNIYEFGWGDNKHLGLGSRQFVTSTVADVSASVGIVGVSTAIGTMIPIPGVGTAAGFVVGLGLQYAYDNWGKEAWRNTVDGAGQWLQNNVPAAIDSVKNFGSSVAQGASDFANSVGEGLSDVGSSISNGLSSAASWIGL